MLQDETSTGSGPEQNGLRGESNESIDDDHGRHYPARGQSHFLRATDGTLAGVLRGKRESVSTDTARSHRTRQDERCTIGSDHDRLEAQDADDDSEGDRWAAAIPVERRRDTSFQTSTRFEERPKMTARKYIWIVATTAQDDPNIHASVDTFYVTGQPDIQAALQAAQDVVTKSIATGQMQEGTKIVIVNRVREDRT